MKNVKNLLILVVIMTMTGCSSTVPLLKIEPVVIPEGLTTPCNEPEDLPDGGNMGDMLAVLIHLAQDYKDCSNRHEALSQVVKQR